MEAVLDLYATPPDPDEPVLCLDEYPYALEAHTRMPQALVPHRGRRVDYEYVRGGGCSLFALFCPATGWREVVVRRRRTRRDFAEVLAALLETHFPDARRIHLVCDNLNTHTPAAFYETFPPAVARALAERVVFQYTPKHGSWLNMVEIEWAILDRQCLARRLADVDTLTREVDAWVAARNAAHATVHWHFTTPDARRWLDRCYPDVVPFHPS